MRKLFAMLTVVALATGMTACSDDDGTETPKDPTTTNFNLRARGGNVMVTGREGPASPNGWMVAMTISSLMERTFFTA